MTAVAQWAKVPGIRTLLCCKFDSVHPDTVRVLQEKLKYARRAQKYVACASKIVTAFAIDNFPTVMLAWQQLLPL